jgi:hypothetical protein
MQRGHLQRAWKAWRATIVAVAAVIAIGSLASASPSLRAPRGSHEPLATGTTGASGPTGETGATGLSGPIGTTGPEIEPVQEESGPPSEGADFSACEGLTGLDNAICRHEALLVVRPDNRGLQNSLAHLQENKTKHEAKSGDDGGDVPPLEDGSSSSSSSSQGHGHSEESHGNAGGNGKNH